MKQMLNPTRVEEIFAEVLGKPSDERDAWLEQACAGDAELREHVEQLLAAHLDVANALPLPTVPTTVQPPVESAGVTIGRYKLLEQIGEGGFGVVFMAEQLTPVRRKVAVKVIKPGYDTGQVIARFEAERQALALMDHENIAKVLDAGATDSGRPYFVMELVHGVPITAYCDTNQFPPRDRLELFVQVCRAVQHAHTKGIIHRDIKPTNVLVALHDGVAVPKVIDFGVAKATGQQLTEKTLFTNFAQMVGTPLYMSPEQAEMTSIDVDTRSDVYSLGVLLYELLTGTTPLDSERLKKAAFDEVRRIIREEEPPRPSTRLSTMGEKAKTISAQRKSDPKHLGQFVRGELDWIVMKALEKNRQRRYETANGLARDVERYLHDEPVEACPPSIGYRLRKFVRKHRGPVIGAALVLLSIVGGAIGAVYGVIESGKQRAAVLQRQIEDEQRASDAAARRSRTAASVATALDDARARSGEAWVLADEPYKMRTATDLALAAVRRAEGFAGAGEASEQTVAELTAVRATVVDLDRHTRLFVAADEALQAKDLVMEIQSSKERTADRLGAAFRAFGWDPIRAPTDAIAAEITASRVRNKILGFLCDWENTYGDQAADERIQKVIRAARVRSGGLLADWQRMKDERDLVGLAGFAARPEALTLGPELLCALSRDLWYYGRHEESVLALLQRAADRYPANVWLNEELSRACYTASPPRRLEAFRAVAAAAAIRPDNVFFETRVAQAYERLGENELAAAQYRKVIALAPTDATAYQLLAAMRSRAGDKDGAIAPYREYAGRVPDSAVSHFYLGKVLLGANDLAGAADAFREAIRLKPEYAAAHDFLGEILRARGDLDGAVAAHKEAVRLVRLDWSNVTNAYENLWTDLLEKNAKLGKTGDAATLAVFAEMNRFDPKDPWPHVKLGTLLWDKGNTNGAIARYRDAVRADPEDSQALHSLGSALLAERDYAGAVAAYQGVIRRWPKDDSAYSQLASVLAHAGDLPGAIAQYNEVLLLKPYDAEAHAKLAKMLAAGPDGVRDGKKAVEHATQACELSYWKEPRHISILAAAYAEAGEFAKAIEYQKKALTFPEFEKQHGAQVRERLDLYLHQKPYRETDWGLHMVAPPGAAVWKYWSAVRRDPKDTTAQYNLGRALQAHGDLVRAEAAYREAVRLDETHHGAAIDSLAELLSLRGKGNEAIAMCQAIVDHDPKDAPTHYRLGNALRNQRKLDEAIDEYREAFRLEREIPDARNHLASAVNKMAWMLATDADPQKRDPGRALTLAKEAVELAPKNADCWNTLGVAHYRAGNWNDAVVALQKHREVRTNDTEWANPFFLAMAQWQLGNKDEARRWYDKAIDWMDHHAPTSESLICFRSEAAQLVGLPLTQPATTPATRP